MAALLASSQSHGLDLDSDVFSLRGFGTLGATHSSEDRADFTGNFVHAEGAGYTYDWATSVDSKVGLQLDTQFNETLAAVIQVVSQYDYRGTYRPDIEWAYVDYALTPELSIRAGRILTSIFMESENLLVGYTYDPVRPPNEFYGIYPLTNEDGIGLRYRFAHGDVANTVQLSYGTANEKMRDDAVGQARIWNLNYLLETGATAFRIAYVDMTLDLSTPDVDALFDGLAVLSQIPGPTGEQAAANRKRLRPNEIPYRIATVGARHEIGNWRLQAEWGKADTEAPSPFASIRAWYATAAHRFGSLTPYATVSRANAHDVPDPTAIPTDGLPLPLAQGVDQLNAGIEAMITSLSFTQKSVAVGVRWDVADNIDLKLQLQRLRTGDHNYGRLTNVQPGFEPGDRIHVVSVTMDFVF